MSNINESLLEGIAGSSEVAASAVDRLTARGIIEPAEEPLLEAVAGTSVSDLITRYGDDEQFQVRPELGNTDVQKLTQLVFSMAKQIKHLEDELLHLREAPEIETEELDGEEASKLEAKIRKVVARTSTVLLRRDYGRYGFRSIPAAERKIYAEVLIERFREEQLEPDPLWIGIAINNGVL